MEKQKSSNHVNLNHYFLMIKELFNNFGFKLEEYNHHHFHILHWRSCLAVTEVEIVGTAARAVRNGKFGK